MELSKHNKKAVLMGATETVGRKLLVQLLQHPAYEKIILLLEEPLDFEHEKLEVHQLSFEKLEQATPWLEVDDVFYCWGQNMRINRDNGTFKPEKTYVYQLAKLAREAGANQFLYLSTVAADPESHLYYRREKWEIEDAIRQDDWWAVHFFRPALITDDPPKSNLQRSVTDFLGRQFKRLLNTGLDKYKPVDALTIARAMVQAAQRFTAGIHIYHSEYLQELANQHQNEIIPGNG